jgi:hypothetical protein
MPIDPEGGEIVPQHRSQPHYHGDEVRDLFLVSALIIIFAKSTGAELPLSTTGAVASAALLVIAAGISNPKQVWIHWFNALLAVIGTLLFGRAAVAHYSVPGANLVEPSFIYVEALALLSLIALFFTTRTIRGILLHQRPH